MNTRIIEKVIQEKGTKICLAADTESVEELLKVADELGPYICVLKIHYDIIPDFHKENCGEKLVELKKRHNFLIWEDRKFADIFVVGRSIINSKDPLQTIKNYSLLSTE